MMELPCTVCINCSSSIPGDSAPTTLITRILGAQQLPDSKRAFHEGTLVYDLHLETKYYSADTWLCTVAQCDLGSESFANMVEAAVLYFDGSWIAAATPWLSFLKQWDPQVRILTCERLSEDETLKSGILDWCSENEFELVELDPSAESLAEAEEYRESVGVTRLLQILKAHSWSNIELKAEPNLGTAERLKEYLAEDETTTIPACSSPSPDTSALPRTDDMRTLAGMLVEGTKPTTSTSANNTNPLQCSDMDDRDVFRATEEGEDPDGVSFEELFAKFASMKDAAEHMPPEQRKGYAEKVTLEFWKAIGGDLNEIAGMDDED